MLSTIVFWVLMAVFALGALVRVAMIGKERKPMTAGEAMWGMIINGLLIWAIATNWDWS